MATTLASIDPNFDIKTWLQTSIDFYEGVIANPAANGITVNATGMTPRLEATKAQCVALRQLLDSLP